jgi:hypothetical protein
MNPLSTHCPGHLLTGVISMPVSNEDPIQRLLASEYCRTRSWSLPCHRPFRMGLCECRTSIILHALLQVGEERRGSNLQPSEPPYSTVGFWPLPGVAEPR